MKTPNDQVATALATADWQDLWPRLLLFSQRRAARLFWRGEYGGAMPGGVKPEDFVMKAIEQALSGERRWDNKISLFAFLCGAISSMLNHAAESVENRITRRVDPRIEEYKLVAPATELADEESLPERFVDSLRDDPLVYKMVAHILSSNTDKPSQLARVLKISVRDVYNANKRLKRKLSEWQRLLEDYS